MCYLCLLVFFLGNVLGDLSFSPATTGGWRLAQQTATGFTDATIKSAASQQSTDTGLRIPESDVSGLKNETDMSEGEPDAFGWSKDDWSEGMELYREELKRAVNSGKMTEEAAFQAWNEAVIKAGKEANQEADGKDWIGANLGLFLTAVYGGIFVLVVSILGICFFYVARREKARTVALAAATAELGLKFEPEGDESLAGDLQHLPLFNLGRRKKLTNLIVADTADLQVHVFDYLFITGYGRSQKTHRTTVVSLRSETLAVPDLQVRPRKAFADGIKAIFGAGGIAMDHHPEFAKAYVVKSDQPQQACDFLDADMVAACQSNPGCSFECQVGVLLHFRAGKRVEPNTESIRGFIGEGFQLFQHVEDRLQRKT